MGSLIPTLPIVVTWLGTVMGAIEKAKKSHGGGTVWQGHIDALGVVKADMEYEIQESTPANVSQDKIDSWLIVLNSANDFVEEQILLYPDDDNLKKANGLLEDAIGVLS